MKKIECVIMDWAGTAVDSPTFASGNSNPRTRGVRFLQRKETKQLVNIN